MSAKAATVNTASPAPESSPVGVGVLPVYNVTPFTMLDYPDHTACVVWMAGCNMRCGYCHNPQIVKGKGRADMGKLMDFLHKRQGLLEGVVLSGGEATLYPGLPAFARKVKDMGYKVKLDTNGTRPEVVKEMIKDGLVDFIALDYKAPRAKFEAVTGMREFDAFSRTLDFLCLSSPVPFEVRTTVHTEILDEADIEAIMSDLAMRPYRGTYYVQNYINNNGNPTLGNLPAQTRRLSRLPRDEARPFVVSYRNFTK